MYYDKRIRYLSYYESGIKLQNAGYVKFQVRDSLCQMIIYMKGPRLMGSGEAKVYLLSETPGRKNEDGFYQDGRKNNLQKHLLGNLSFRNGQGHCAVRLNAENMGDSGLRYDEACGIKIELHEYQYMESRWVVTNFMPKRQGMQEDKENGYRLRKPQGSSMEEKDRWDLMNKEAKAAPVKVDLIVTPVSENLRVEKLAKEEPVEEITMEKLPAEELLQGPTAEDPEEAFAETVSETGRTADKIAEDKEDSMQEMLEREVLREEAKTVQLTRAEQPGQPEQTLEEEILKGMEETEIPEVTEAAEEISLPEQELQPDKWEQLRKNYPIVHPIREEEEYLKISPKDFVIFTEKYQELVHNSFLLHGYYNYKHLILGKKEKDGKVIYYLGVPGTFHEREKAVAVMFGFEAFDGKREPAENGDFGYYLRRVEI